MQQQAFNAGSAAILQLYTVFRKCNCRLLSKQLHHKQTPNNQSGKEITRTMRDKEARNHMVQQLTQHALLMLPGTGKQAAIKTNFQNGISHKTKANAGWIAICHKAFRYWGRKMSLGKLSSLTVRKKNKLMLCQNMQIASGHAVWCTANRQWQMWPPLSWLWLAGAEESINCQQTGASNATTAPSADICASSCQWLTVRQEAGRKSLPNG